MGFTNDEIMGIFFDEVPNGGVVGGCVGPSLRIVEGGLVYHRTAGYRRTHFGPVTLVQYSEKNKVWVVNGDALPDPSATRWQGNARNCIVPQADEAGNRTTTFRPTYFKRGHWTGRTATAEVPVSQAEPRYVLVPFAALRGAGIDPLSIIPIEVTYDTWEHVRHEVPPPPKFDPEKNIAGADSTYSRSYRYESNGHLYIAAAVNRNRSWNNEPDEWIQSGGWFVNARDINGISTRRQLQSVGPQQWFWTERVHHLGGSLFSGKSEDGRRHRFVSAFDDLESPPMYFLAQIPDKSKATTLAEAIMDLRPPLVVKAMEDGRQVLRQGDVFAVETNLTDEQIYAQAKTRVRREVAMSATVEARVIAERIRNGRVFPEPAEGEVRERALCPCGCGHKRWFGNTEKCRHALSIYRTGHTATEVVVGRGGACYIKGSMHHDPAIEEPGRRGEHRAVVLPEGVWFLCVRNTVPRRKVRREVQEEAA